MSALLQPPPATATSSRPVRHPGAPRRRAPLRLTLALAVVAWALGGSLLAALRPPTAGATGGCALSRGSLALDGEEADLLRRLNDYRARNGLVALALSPALMASAAWKSADLGANAYFGHDDLGRSWSQRLRDCGYNASPNIAENLAAGYADGAATFEQWRASSGHNANMLNPTMRVAGLARAYTPGSPYGWYWTANFGAVADSSGPPPAPPAPARNATADGPLPPGGALGVGATAIVSGTGDCLRVHDAPTVAANPVACLADGAAMIVGAGPVSADGYVWWRLGALGWVVNQYLTLAP